MNYLICDDEPGAADSLKEKISALEPDACVRTFVTLRALVFNAEDIADRIDGVFLGVKPNCEEATAAAEQLVALHPEICVVYLIDCAAECLQELYCVSSKALPVAVLMKPVEMRYLQNALDKMRDNGDRAELLPIKSGGTVIYIRPADVISVTSRKRKLFIRTASASYEIYGRISGLCAILPPGFTQCHKSCIVNLKHISRIIGWTSLEMSDGSVLPISRTYKENIKTEVALMNP